MGDSLSLSYCSDKRAGSCSPYKYGLLVYHGRVFMHIPRPSQEYSIIRPQSHCIQVRLLSRSLQLNASKTPTSCAGIISCYTANVTTPSMLQLHARMSEITKIVAIHQRISSQCSPGPHTTWVCNQIGVSPARLLPYNCQLLWQIEDFAGRLSRSSSQRG